MLRSQPKIHISGHRFMCSRHHRRDEYVSSKIASCLLALVRVWLHPSNFYCRDFYPTDKFRLLFEFKHRYRCKPKQVFSRWVSVCFGQWRDTRTCKQGEPGPFKAETSWSRIIHVFLCIIVYLLLLHSTSTPYEKIKRAKLKIGQECKHNP